MEISTLFQNEYPSFYLGQTRQVRDIQLTFDDSVSERFQQQLRSALSDMFVELDSYNEFASSVHILISAEGKSITLHCSKDISLVLTLEGRDLCSNAAWCIYLIASGNHLMKGRTTATVRAEAFNLEQELMSCSVRGAVEIHRTGRIPKNRYKNYEALYRNCVENISNSLASHAPTFSNLPIPTLRLENAPGRYWKSVTYLNLLQNLGCGTSPSDQLNSFCEMTRSSEEYQQKIQQAVTHCLTTVSCEPLSDIGNVMEAVAEKLKTSYHEQYNSYVNSFNTELNKSCNPGKFTASRFIQLFSPMDEAMRRMASAKINTFLVHDFYTAFMSRYKNVKSDALKKLSKLHARSNGLINAANFYDTKSLRLNWQDLTINYNAAHASWADKGGAMALDIVNGTAQNRPDNFVCTWLCSREVADLFQKQTLQGKHEYIPGLQGHWLIAILIK